MRKILFENFNTGDENGGFYKYVLVWSKIIIIKIPCFKLLRQDRS